MGPGTRQSQWYHSSKGKEQKKDPSAKSGGLTTLNKSTLEAEA